jgi:tetrapyrrole methylase family protein/MazG family protein
LSTIFANAYHGENMTEAGARRKADRRSFGTFSGLRRIIATLRSPEGCPWDRVQTHRTLRPYLLEEAYETVDALNALDQGNPDSLREELGDLLFQVLIHTQLAEEAGEFTMRDVLRGITEKLVRRHPHVFGDVVAGTPEAVVEQWDDLKALERGAASALAGIPRSLPALSRAQSLQRRAARAGFTFLTLDDAWRALDEELTELREASTPAEQREETGDALFALANLAQQLEIDAQEALNSTCRGFEDIYRRMEFIVKERGLDLKDLPYADKLALWEEAKGMRE